MSRSKLSNDIASAMAVYVAPDDDTPATAEDLRREADQAKSRDGSSMTEAKDMENKRNALLRKAGYDFVDINEIHFNDANTYSVDPESIEGLADLIRESGNTTPIILRAKEGSLELVDGERRTRAHLLLDARYPGEHWNMIPARIFEAGTLTDEDSVFMMHAENIGQRRMTDSERAEGFNAVAKRIVARRRTDPSLAGRATTEILAEQMGVSQRTAAMELNIARNLSDEAKKVYDEGGMTKTAADAVARLTQDEQGELLAQLSTGRVTREQVETVAKKRGRKPGQKNKTHSTNDYLVSARDALKKANLATGEADPRLVESIRKYLEMIDVEEG